jgi:hypothetical protein
VTVEKLLTARQVTDAFGFLSPGWEDPMPSYRLGADHGSVRFRASEVEAWLQRRSTKASRNAS